ncbi:hypothetical protein [Aquiflexum sp.]|uniref:hypothetical protein n=1 Tax=Aquiflexum sp. TaxID=1872584 RepID=UPI0035942F6F
MSKNKNLNFPHSQKQSQKQPNTIIKARKAVLPNPTPMVMNKIFIMIPVKMIVPIAKFKTI